MDNEKSHNYTDEQLDRWTAEAESGYDIEQLTPIDAKTMQPVDLRGRPSLNGNGHSPKLQVRVDDQLNRALKARAEKEGRSVSDLVRELLRAAV